MTTAVPTPQSTRPRMHGTESFLRAKRGRLSEPHVAPINTYLQALEEQIGKPIPSVDPDSGGVTSRVLLLFESPSRKGVQLGSGIISCDNDDLTAKNVWEAHRATGLLREWCIAWNIVPWYVGTVEENHAPTKDDLQNGSALLPAFIDLLPDLQVVIPIGKAAARGLEPIADWLKSKDITIIENTPHPSPRVFNRWPSAKPSFHASFTHARELVETRCAPRSGSTERKANRVLFDLDVEGRPATFATSSEKAWKAQVDKAFQAAQPLLAYEPATTLFKVRFRFRTPPPGRASEVWDLDNLVKPTLDAMEAVFGRREGNWHRQPADDRVVQLEASKRTARSHESPGAKITVWHVEEEDVDD